MPISLHTINFHLGSVSYTHLDVYKRQMLFRSDKFRSFSSRNLFRGAAVLTAAGLITRIMGFFFRIFLSHAFGEENVGLYQLIFPVYALCLSVSTFGIQTAVSHMVAEKMSSVVTYSAASSSSPHIDCLLYTSPALSAPEIHRST